MTSMSAPSWPDAAASDSFVHTLVDKQADLLQAEDNFDDALLNKLKQFWLAHPERMI